MDRNWPATHRTPGVLFTHPRNCVCQKQTAAADSGATGGTQAESLSTNDGLRGGQQARGYVVVEWRMESARADAAFAEEVPIARLKRSTHSYAHGGFMALAPSMMSEPLWRQVLKVRPEFNPLDISKQHPFFFFFFFPTYAGERGRICHSFFAALLPSFLLTLFRFFRLALQPCRPLTYPSGFPVWAPCPPLARAGSWNFDASCSSQILQGDAGLQMIQGWL